jgi:hypothetical protein
VIPARALWFAFALSCLGALALTLAGCTYAQQQADKEALLKFEAQMKADAQKAQVVLDAIAANGAQLAECTASVVASTALAIATSNYLGLIGGYACIPSAALKLTQDIKAGLAKLPPLDAVRLAQSVAAAAEIAKQIVAPIIAPMPIPLPPPGLPAPLINP